jgi:putative oxidoreductase
MSYGLLLLRVVIGGTLFAHGAQKLFGWFGGHGLRGTAGFFGSTGWRLPLVMAFLAGLGETSGLAFAFGLLTPLAALGIATVMLNAIFAVHWRNGFFNGDGGVEFPLAHWREAQAAAKHDDILPIVTPA